MFIWGEEAVDKLNTCKECCWESRSLHYMSLQQPENIPPRGWRIPSPLHWKRKMMVKWRCWLSEMTSFKHKDGLCLHMHLLELIWWFTLIPVGDDVLEADKQTSDHVQLVDGRVDGVLTRPVTLQSVSVGNNQKYPAANLEHFPVCGTERLHLNKKGGINIYFVLAQLALVTTLKCIDSFCSVVG